jgi:hypothetical protein
MRFTTELLAVALALADVTSAQNSTYNATAAAAAQLKAELANLEKFWYVCDGTDATDQIPQMAFRPLSPTLTQSVALQGGITGSRESRDSRSKSISLDNGSALDSTLRCIRFRYSLVVYHLSQRNMLTVSFLCRSYGRSPPVYPTRMFRLRSYLNCILTFCSPRCRQR